MTLGLRLSKYKAVPTEVDGIRWPSKKHARRYQELKVLLHVGMITDLEWEVTYDLVVNGILICRYRADWRYRNQKKEIVVEDTKGFETRKFKIKSKLMLACHNIRIVLT